MSIASIKKRLEAATPLPWMMGSECEFEPLQIIAYDGTPYPDVKFAKYDKEEADPSIRWYQDHYRGTVVEEPNSTVIGDEQQATNRELFLHAPHDLALLLEVAEAAHVIAQQLPLLGWPKELANDDADMRLVAALDALHAAD